jgi:hypothetical protein
LKPQLGRRQFREISLSFYNFLTSPTTNWSIDFVFLNFDVVAIDAETTLVSCFRVGKRTKPHAIAFMADLSERLANCAQLLSDALNSYVDAVEQSFGAEFDCGQAVKFYEAEPIGPGRYSAPKVVHAEGAVIAGPPNEAALRHFAMTYSN